MLMNSDEYLAIVEQLKREIKKTQYQSICPCEYRDDIAVS